MTLDLMAVIMGQMKFYKLAVVIFSGCVYSI